MTKIKKHILIARTQLTGYSSMSNSSAIALAFTLRKFYKKVSILQVNSQDDLDSILSIQPDLVFIGMKFLPLSSTKGSPDQVKIWIAEFLEKNSIPYTGSPSSAHKLEYDKSSAKRRMNEVGIKTAQFFVSLYDQSYEINSSLTYPVFVKPLNKGGGMGIDVHSVAYTEEALCTKVADIKNTYHCDVLVEEYLAGREFSVALLENNGQYVVMPLELIAPIDSRGHRVLSSSVKSDDSEQFIAVDDEIMKSVINSFALEAFTALHARGYGRIDIRLDNSGIPHFLEANLLPSIIENYGNFPKACMLNEGISYEEMAVQIVELGLGKSDSVNSNEESLLQLETIQPVLV